MRQVLFHIPLQAAWLPEGVPLPALLLGLGLALWLSVVGILGARITFLRSEVHPDTVKDFFAQLPRIGDGGIVLYGSVLGGLAGYLGAWFFIFRKLKVPTLKLADIVAPAVAV